MRRVRYRVVASLDGYIAGPHGEFDWIPSDPSIDLGAAFAGVDAVLLGRRTYDLTRVPGAPPWPAGIRVYVFSRTLRAADHPDVTIVRDDPGTAVAALRAAPGADIWLFGGGQLFGSLLAAGQVDAVEVTVAPILLGGGVPLVPPGARRTPLALTHVERHPSGMVSLHYAVPRAAA